MGGYATGLSFPLIMEDIFGITLVFTKLMIILEEKCQYIKK